jgi:hypothetical protein
LICFTSLMSHFLYLWTICMSSFKKQIFWASVNFYNKVTWFLPAVSPSHMFGYEHLIEYRIRKYFLPSPMFFPNSVGCFTAMQNLFIHLFIQSIFGFFTSAFEVICKKSLPRPKPWGFSLSSIYLFHKFRLTFKSLIHFVLIWDTDLVSFFCVWIFNLPSRTDRKD